MQHRTLPSTGTTVSGLALGTMGFGTETPQDEAHAVLDGFLEAGGTFHDTSDVYGAGASEEVLGQWFSSRPFDVTDRVVLATKGRFGTGPDANDVGSSRRHLDRTLTGSLRRLGLDTVDLYQLHGWDPITPIEETLRFLDDAVRAGKIHYIGLSNFTGWQTQLTVDTAKAMGTVVPVSMQTQYNLIVRDVEHEIIPASLHNGLGILPWSPLASGFLTGKYQRDQSAGADSRGGSGAAMFDYILGGITSREQSWAILDAVRDIATHVGATPSQVALRWLADRPGVTAPIIGAKTVAQLEQNLAALDVDLDAAATARLDEVSTPVTGSYPYGPFGTKQRGRYVDSSDQVINELY